MLALRKYFYVAPLKIRDLQKHKQQSCQNRHNFRHQFVLPTLLQSWSKVWPLTQLFCFSAQSWTNSRVAYNFPTYDECRNQVSKISNPPSGMDLAPTHPLPFLPSAKILIMTLSFGALIIYFSNC